MSAEETVRQGNGLDEDRNLTLDAMQRGWDCLARFGERLAVRAASTVGKETKGYDAGKKISGRKTFGIVGTLGLLMAVTVVAASASDNAGGIVVADLARHRSSRFAKLWCDGGFKRTFIEHCRDHHISVEVVNKAHLRLGRHEFGRSAGRGCH